MTLSVLARLTALVFLSVPLAGQAPDLAFTENRGQWPEPVAFATTGGAARAWITPSGFTVTLERPVPDGMSGPAGGVGLPRHGVGCSHAEGVALRVAFDGAQSKAPRGEQVRADLEHYLRGSDPAGWVVEAPRYARVRWPNAWPGVDVVLRADERFLSYDLELTSGVDLGTVRLRAEGATGMRIAPDGRLVMDTALGEVWHTAPVAWYDCPDGTREPVPCRFVLDGPDRYGFAVSASPRLLPLVVDPGVRWGEAVGGSLREWGLAVEPDGAGGVVTAGATESTGFPTTPGAYQTTLLGLRDVWVRRYGPDTGGGRPLLWSAVLGGSQDEWALDVDFDSRAGIVTVAGVTRSSGFPVTANGYQTTMPGGTDGFLAQLSANGSSLVYSTFVGGPNYDDWITDVEVDGAGVITFAGHGSWYMAALTTPNALQPTYGGGARDVILGRLDPQATSPMTYLTFLGGTAAEGFWLTNPYDVENSDLLALLLEGNRIVLTGFTRSQNFPTTDGSTHADPTWGDVFLSIVDPTLPPGQQLVYSTLLGDTYEDWPQGLAAHPAGGYVIGGTALLPQRGPPQFPLTSNAYSMTGTGFVLWLDPMASPPLRYATRLGTGVNDVAVDGSGIITAVGDTDATLLATPGAAATTFPGGHAGFLARLLPSSRGARQLHYLTYFGGTASSPLLFGTWVWEVLLDELGDATVVGHSWSQALPIPNAMYGGQQDAFVADLDLMPLGTSRTGNSTPGCDGPIYLGVDALPTAGDAQFTVFASNAPPNTLCALFVGFPLVPPVGQYGATLHVTSTLGIATGLTDGLGLASQRLPLPPGLAFPLNVSMQFAFLNAPSCTNPLPFSASHRLDI